MNGPVRNFLLRGHGASTADDISEVPRLEPELLPPVHEDEEPRRCMTDRVLQPVVVAFQSLGAVGGPRTVGISHPGLGHLDPQVGRDGFRSGERSAGGERRRLEIRSRLQLGRSLSGQMKGVQQSWLAHSSLGGGRWQIHQRLGRVPIHQGWVQGVPGLELSSVVIRTDRDFQALRNLGPGLHEVGAGESIGHGVVPVGGHGYSSAFEFCHHDDEHGHWLLLVGHVQRPGSDLGDVHPGDGPHGLRSSCTCEGHIDRGFDENGSAVVAVEIHHTVHSNFQTPS
ncbi:hypothetical protein Mapa_004618 [Marchantia paleacea]|nr:hypothetical protein Mapa_004618 [Marchantia paleacea]